jgi:hypothetical protein
MGGLFDKNQLSQDGQRLFERRGVLETNLLNTGLLLSALILVFGYGLLVEKTTAGFVIALVATVIGVISGISNQRDAWITWKLRNGPMGQVRKMRLSLQRQAVVQTFFGGVGVAALISGFAIVSLRSHQNDLATIAAWVSVGIVICLAIFAVWVIRMTRWMERS